MPNNDRMKRLGCVRGASARPLPKILRAALFLAAAQVIAVATAPAHEGHDHDKPAPLNLPIAPRVVAVTPDYEVVGVISGEQRLTIFLHHFATGEPVKDARITVSAGDQEAEAIAKEPGVFDLTASWLRTADGIDLIFRLTLPDDEDILTARLEAASTAAAVAGQPPSRALITAQSLLIGLGGLAAGALLTLLIGANVRRRRAPADEAAQEHQTTDARRVEAKEKQLLRAPVAMFAALFAVSLLWNGTASSQTAPHCHRFRRPWRRRAAAHGRRHPVRAQGDAASAVGPHHPDGGDQGAAHRRSWPARSSPTPTASGASRAGHAGRIEAPEGGLAFVGKRVEKGDLLALPAAPHRGLRQGQLQGEIAELEARIALQEAKLGPLSQGAAGGAPRSRSMKPRARSRRCARSASSWCPPWPNARRSAHRSAASSRPPTWSPARSVDAREVLFEIVDPSRFWVEAIAHDPSVAANLSKAFAVTDTRREHPASHSRASGSR